MMVLNGILILVDLIWLLSVGSIWTATEKNNPVWGHLHALHVFVIIISVINLILKVSMQVEALGGGDRSDKLVPRPAAASG